VADLTCLREEELLEELSAGREPLGELATHIAACPSCSELALVAGAILDDRTIAMREAAVPPSGAVWWRMQMRAYQEAQRATTRTVTLVQAIALLAALAIAFAFLGGQSLLASLSSLRHMPLAPFNLPLAIAVAFLLIATPVGLWAAMRDDRSGARRPH